MQFRKKPVVIEAHCWDGDISALADWLRPFSGSVHWNVENGGILIPTLEGVMRADRGDWIIRGVKREFYPCKPDVFEATYEPVSASPEEP
jgi:hypothetical protein